MNDPTVYGFFFCLGFCPGEKDFFEGTPLVPALKIYREFACVKATATANAASPSFFVSVLIGAATAAAGGGGRGL